MWVVTISLAATDLVFISRFEKWKIAFRGGKFHSLSESVSRGLRSINKFANELNGGMIIVISQSELLLRIKKLLIADRFSN